MSEKKRKIAGKSTAKPNDTEDPNIKLINKFLLNPNKKVNKK